MIETKPPGFLAQVRKSVSNSFQGKRVLHLIPHSPMTMVTQTIT